jgi:predicted GIY-YIG superfamily endonuclease
MKTRTERGPQQTAQCLYSITCEYGRSYIGETGRTLPMRLHEHRHNLQQRLLKKSKLAQHAYEEGITVWLDDARILEVESNSRFIKYKESAHIACLTITINQPNFDISPIWIPHISNEVSNSQKRSV